MRAKTAVAGAALLLFAHTAGAAVQNPPSGRYASVVLDSDTGTVLYERNAEFPRYPASLTKMMTLYLTFEALKAGRIKLTDRMPVSEHAACREPSRLGVNAGSTLVLEEAIRSMTTLSANDAATVVAEALGKGSETLFAEMMTAKAHALGMKQSTFRNASGLPESGHVTSALDLAILARALVRDFPEYYHFFSLSSFEFGGRHYPSQNRFLRTYAGADGLKTGYINSSGHNLAASAVRGGRRLIAVVLGGDKASWTREYASRLLDVAYNGIDPQLLVVAKAPAAPPAAAATTTATVTATATPTPNPAQPQPSSVSVVAAQIPSPGRSSGTETLLASATQAPKAPSPAAAQNDGRKVVTVPAAVAKTVTPPIAAPQAPAAAVTAAVKIAAPAAATPIATAPAKAPDAAPAKANEPAAVKRIEVGAPKPPTKVAAAASSPPAAPAVAATVPPAVSTPTLPSAAATPAAQAAIPPRNSADGKPEATGAAKAAPTAIAAATSSGRLRAGAWAVQVGLYPDRKTAERRGQEARERAPGLGGAALMVAGVGDGGHVSPRFDGLTETDARQTCTELQHASLPCIVVPPGRDLVVATN